MTNPAPLIVILGPTASGKTRVAARAAHLLPGEVISADSRQVYRDLDIGVGKDLGDYLVAGHEIPYHLIGHCDLSEEYNVHRFQVECAKALQDIRERKKQPILCGGTGLYIQAFLDQYQFTGIPTNTELREELSSQTREELIRQLEGLSFPESFQPDTTTTKRIIRAIEIGTFLRKGRPIGISAPASDMLLFGIRLDRDVRRHRITERLQRRLEHGLIEEVEALMAQGVSRERLRRLGLEYKWVTDFIDGLIDRERLFTGLNTAIHQFAKRQMTWFRKMEREGHRIEWIEGTDPLEKQVQTIVDKSCGKLD